MGRCDPFFSTYAIILPLTECLRHTNIRRTEQPFEAELGDTQPGIVSHDCKPKPRKTERLWVRGQLKLHSEILSEEEKKEKPFLFKGVIK